MQRTIWTLLGFLGGIIFYVACNGSNSHSAAAAASDCNEWSIQVDPSKECDSLGICSLYAGWEPFAVANGVLYVRRCDD